MHRCTPPRSFGAGLSAAVQGTISHQIMHVTDWLPTLVAGVAGVPLGAGGRACRTCNRSVAPFDGVDQWSMLAEGAPSARTEVLYTFEDCFPARLRSQPGGIAEHVVRTP